MTFLISFIFTSPFAFYQIHKYIEPALKEELKKNIFYILALIYIFLLEYLYLTT